MWPPTLPGFGRGDASLSGQGSPPGRNPTGIELKVLVGDAKAGETYFAAACSKCHSVTGDLKGIGGKFPDARALQNAWVSGSSAAFGGFGGGRGGAAGAGNPATVTMADGSKIELAPTKHGASKDIVIHVPAEAQAQPAVGEKLVLHVDWPRRYKLMRMHTACHLLSVVCSYPITGAAVGEEESRVDFDMTDTIDKDEVTAKLMELVNENHPVYLQWITDEELAANPAIVKSKNVQIGRAHV